MNISLWLHVEIGRLEIIFILQRKKWDSEKKEGNQDAKKDEELT